MNEKEIICGYCNEKVPEQKDQWPTWFGRYIRENLVSVICKDCLKTNKEKWRDKKI